MTSFPPDVWDCRVLADFHNYVLAAPTASKLRMAALLAASPAGGMEGSFRFALASSEHVAIRAAIKDVIPIPEFAGMVLSGQFLPGHQITINTNSTCSPWVDVEELIKAQDIDIYGPDGQAAHEQFLGMMAEARAIEPSIGKVNL
jgi:hypothetical protein